MQAKLLSWDFAGRAANPCIGPDRADLVLAGCAILEAIRRRWPSPRMRVADRGLREGLLTDMMADDGVWRRNRSRRGQRAEESKGREMTKPTIGGQPHRPQARPARQEEEVEGLLEAVAATVISTTPMCSGRSSRAIGPAPPSSFWRSTRSITS